MTLCERGHDVTLYEKTGQIGGNVIDAALPDFKVDMKDYAKWLQYQADKYAKEYGAKILLNTTATKEMLDAENYDAVIVAIGADPVIPKSIPGIDKDIVAYAPDAEAGRVPCEGNNIVVIGAGSIGMEAAVDYALQGRHVEVVEMMSYDEAFWKLRAAAGNSAREMYERIIPEKDVVLHNRTKLVEVKDHSVVCENMDTGEQFEIACDKVLLGMGQVAKPEEADQFRHCAPEHDVHLIGDCVKAATISDGIVTSAPSMKKCSRPISLPFHTKNTCTTQCSPSLASAMMSRSSSFVSLACCTWESAFTRPIRSRNSAARSNSSSALASSMRFVRYAIPSV